MLIVVAAILFFLAGLFLYLYMKNDKVRHLTLSRLLYVAAMIAAMVGAVLAIIHVDG